MKNIFKYSMLLVAATMLLASCSDDRDSNPVLQTPESFVLNTPAYANQPVDLTYYKELRNTVNFTWSQPDYGFPAKVDYTVELSLSNEWTISNEEETADHSGATQCNYYKLDDTFNECHGEIAANKVAKAVQMMADFTDPNDEEIPEEEVVPIPNDTTVYARVKAITKGSSYVISNVVKFKVAPVFVDLSPANPVLWYMVGDCIGNGTWGNSSASDIGKSLIPLLPVPDGIFDENGDGDLIYIGYIPGGNFKFIKEPGSWEDDKQMHYGHVDLEHSVSVNKGENDNIIIGEGYFKITVNTIKKKVLIEKYEPDETPKLFPTITLSGNAMTAMEGVQNHEWYLDATFDENTELKFNDGTEDISWSSDYFPFGEGTQGGPNIPVKAGKYRIYFNDILGYYYFVAEK